MHKYQRCVWHRMRRQPELVVGVFECITKLYVTSTYLPNVDTKLLPTIPLRGNWQLFPMMLMVSAQMF